jgi:predicted membrane protein
MDFENKQDERRDWREERRKWREERHKRREERAQDYRERWLVRYHQSGGGNVWTGLFLLIIGGIALAKTLGAIPQEFGWLWSWQMLLIGIGFFLGVRHGFRGGAWLILMVVGGVFIMRDFYGTIISWQYLWPTALILLGLFIIIRPHRHHRYIKEYVDQKVDDAMKNSQQASTSNEAFTASEDFIDTTSIFGGVKKNVISKNFKGGDITNIMGGSEIDLTQADINGTVTIDLTQVFGGTKLIVPSNWQVKAQMAAIFGGVEDKRSAQHSILDPNKTLILDGTSIFGGIEIKSY